MITCIVCDSGYNPQLVRETEAVLAALQKQDPQLELWILRPAHSTATLPEQGFCGCPARVLNWECGGWCNPQQAAVLLDGQLRAQPGLVVFAGGNTAAVTAIVFAARRGLPVRTDLQALTCTADGVLTEKLVYAGCLQANFRLPKQAVVTFAKGALSNAQPIGAAGGMQRLNLTPLPQAADLRVKRTENDNALAGAEVVLAAGRGVASRAELAQLAALAERLGGQLAASRPIVMNGWIEQDRLLGISGEVVAPRLAIAVGISGSAAFLYGVRNAQTLLAVNNDKDSPIFNQCDYGLLEDWKVLCSRLQDELENEHGGMSNE